MRHAGNTETHREYWDMYAQGILRHIGNTGTCHREY
jgi:hypothetical protein